MYLQHFGLKREPFSIAPDPRFLFMSDRHREALAHLVYGLGAGGGFVLLTGEIGAGKTTVFRCLMEQLPKRSNVAYIYNPKLSVLELLQAVCDEFHVPVAGEAASRTNKAYVDALNEYLLRTHAVGQNNVLIIDEAQNLPADVLEQLRLLTNLETAERKLLQIVLIGQPELRDLLDRPDLEQLAQRVVARYHLTALSEDETQKYISHRLVVAGASGRIPFERDARRMVYELSRGIPRRINLLCDRALLGAYGSGLTRVSPAIVQQAAAEVFGTTDAAVKHQVRWSHPWLLLAGAGLGLLGLTAALYWMSSGPTSRAKAPVSASAPAAASEARAASGAASAVPGGASGAVSGAGSGAVSSGTVAPAAAASDFVSPDPASARNLDAAWRELARAWALELPGTGEACAAAARSQVACFRGQARDWDALRRLGRPVILTLQDQSKRPVYAILTALGPLSATVSVGGSRQTVALAGLSKIWLGSYATLWRPPPGYTTGASNSLRHKGPLADWLALRLKPYGPASGASASGSESPEALAERLKDFQRQRGLDADGIVGPVVLMHLNAVTGVNEPKLLNLP